MEKKVKLDSAPGDDNQSAAHTSTRSIEELSHQVFSNDLVWPILGQFLGLGDLKACRLVNRQFNRKVMDCTGFKSRALVRLYPKDLSPTEFGKTMEKWKNLSFRIEGSIFDRDEDGNDEAEQKKNWLYSLMDQVEFLIIRDKCVSRFPPSIEQLLKAPMKLRGLRIDINLLSACGGDKVLRSCRSVVSGIRQLEITCYIYGPSLAGVADCFKELGHSATNLSIFKFGQGYHGAWDHDRMDALVRFVTQNSAQLRTVHLGPYWCSTLQSAFNNNQLVFAVLKELYVQLGGVNPLNLCHVFVAHPALEDLRVYFPRSHDDTDSVVPRLLEVIRENGRRLKTLHIWMAYISSTWSASGETRHELLSLVKNLSLEEFQLTFSVCDHDNNGSSGGPDPASLLSSFQPSIRRIVFNYKCRGGQHSPIAASHFANIDPLKLTVLCLNHSGCGVTDKTAEFICRNLRLLQKLDLSGSKCTDYGFIGTKLGADESSTSEFSLSNLKGLKILVLNSCKNITDQTLMEGIQFMELKHLDLGNNHQFTDKAFEQVLEQNPSLEFFAGQVQSKRLRDLETARAYAPRLKKYGLYKSGYFVTFTEQEEQERKYREHVQRQQEYGGQVGISMWTSQIGKWF